MVNKFVYRKFVIFVASTRRMDRKRKVNWGDEKRLLEMETNGEDIRLRPVPDKSSLGNNII